MTYETLKKEIAALGFESDTEQDTFLLFAANRAQRMIGAEFPLEATYTLYQAPVEPLLHLRDVPTSFTCERACAVSFRSVGDGSYTVTAKGNSVRYSFSDGKRIHRHGVVAGTRFQFSGTVFDLATYEDVYEGAEDIPVYYERIPYYPSDFIPDFLSLIGAPTSALGKPIAGVVREKNLLLVPRNYHGHIRIRYRRRERPITKEEGAVDILPEAEHLLPLLAAAYLWLDDEPEKAQYYMALYREASARLRAARPTDSGATYEDVLGWA